jgi:hypothetical protein
MKCLAVSLSGGGVFDGLPGKEYLEPSHEAPVIL